MDERNENAKIIEFNGTVVSRVVIDQHYKENHDDISDELILDMLEFKVNGVPVDPDSETDEDGFRYFKIEQLEFQDRYYRMILLTCKNEDFLGVVNAFRVEKKK